MPCRVGVVPSVWENALRNPGQIFGGPAAYGGDGIILALPCLAILRTMIPFFGESGVMGLWIHSGAQRRRGGSIWVCGPKYVLARMADSSNTPLLLPTIPLLAPEALRGRPCETSIPLRVSSWASWAGVGTGLSSPTEAGGYKRIAEEWQRALWHIVPQQRARGAAQLVAIWRRFGGGRAWWRSHLWERSHHEQGNFF